MNYPEYQKPEFIREIPEKRIRSGRVGLYKCMMPGCGQEFEAVISIVNREKRPIKSCGCYQKIVAAKIGRENKTHGMSSSSEYAIYRTMKARCNNPNHWEYEEYGGKGIKVCEQWSKCFENFYADMGPKPGKNYSIHRVNNSCGYKPSNCKWATAKEQARNTRRNRLLTYNGYTATVAEWSELTGLSRNVIEARIDYYGFSVEEALTTPKLKNQFTPITEKIVINLPENKK